jgi:putative ABC transport system substrate-binding protein
MAPRGRIRLAAAILVGVVAAALAWNTRTEPYDIHYVNYRGRTNVDAGFEAYLDARGVKYAITYHNADRDPTAFPYIVSRINADKRADLVVTWGTTVTLAIFGKHDDRTPTHIELPGVFTVVSDAKRSKIIDPADETRHITGATHVPPLPRQFSAMMIYKPGKAIGVLYTPTENNSVVILEQLKELGERYGVHIVAIPFALVDGKPVSTNTKAALAQFKKEGCEWLYLPPDSYLGTQARDVVLPEAHRLGLVTFASTEQLMQAGAAFGFVSTYYDLGALAGEQAYEILVERKAPGEIPVTTVGRFQHQMNVKTAKALGVEILPELKSDIVEVSP